MMREMRWRNGGGHDASLRLFAVLGVVGAMVLAGLVLMDDAADSAVGNDPTGTSIPSGYVYEGLKYDAISGFGEVEVTGFEDDPIGELVIPSTIIYEGREYSVVSIGDWAFDRAYSMTSITIPDSVTSIGTYAFEYTDSLESVTIPDSVTTIGDWAFAESGIQSISIPGSVKTFGVGLFSDCMYLVSVTIGDGVSSISSGMFQRCIHLESISFPESIDLIGDWAFYQCESLSLITFESNEPPIIAEGSFTTGTELNVYTPGWDPTTVLTGNIIDDGDVHTSTVVWANPFPSLTFASSPSQGTVSWMGRETVYS